MYQSSEQKAFARHLRSNATDAERKLWARLKKKQLLGARFRRQVPVGPYIVDFECFEAKLVVEIDGGQHNSDAGRRHDTKRTSFLNNHGYGVVRFWNTDVDQDLDSVVEAIALKLQSRLAGRPHPGPPPEGEGDK